jgi:hypothetical protein
MNGMLFVMLADLVCEDFSPALWDDILTEAGVVGVYTSLGDYPDAELFALVDAAVHITNLPQRDVLLLAGRQGFRRLAVHVASVLAGIPTWHELLMGLDATVHAEVAKLSDVPRQAVFHGTRVASEVVELRYEGGRGLCVVGEGLIRGAGDWYGVELAVDQVECVHRGGDACTFTVEQVPT